MVFTRSIGLAAAIAILASTPASADPAGLWREKDGGTIRVFHCGAAYCAVIASVNPPLDPATRKPATDKNNPDAQKRSRPLVGVAVLSAMRPNGSVSWPWRSPQNVSPRSWPTVAPACLYEHTCSSYTCEDVAGLCEVTYCSADALEEGESCSNPTE